MNWEVSGAVSEFVGAIVVIITLLYVARQIRQVNAQGQASARFSFTEAYGQMNTAISSSKEVASLFRRGFKGEQHGKYGVHDNFRTAVDEALASGEKSYTMD